MQTLKSSRENINAQFAGHVAPSRFTQRIGSTVFTVNVHSKEGKSEKLEDKVFRLIKRDLECGINGKISREALTIAGNNGIMNIPQADLLPEGSSI